MPESLQLRWELNLQVCASLNMVLKILRFLTPSKIK